MNAFIQEEKENPIVTLKAQAEKFDYSKLRAGEDNAEATSGYQTYKDIDRMGFVIQDRTITKEFINELYNRYNNLVKSKQYREFAKEVFKEMFNYAKAEVPSDPILEELVTNCNQAGYVGSLMGDDKPLTKVSHKYGLSFESIDYETHINYDSKKNHATIKVEEPISTRVIAKPEEELCKLDSSLEFTLESQNDKDDVIYKDGKLSLTAPKRLKDYNIGDKNLFDVIKECFQKFCERLGFFKIKIKHGLDKPPKVNSHLESVEPPVHSNEHGNTP